MKWYNNWKAWRAARKQERIERAKLAIEQASAQQQNEFDELTKLYLDKVKELEEHGFKRAMNNIHYSDTTVGGYLVGPDGKTTYSLIVHKQGAAHIKSV